MWWTVLLSALALFHAGCLRLGYGDRHGGPPGPTSSRDRDAAADRDAADDEPAGAGAGAGTGGESADPVGGRGAQGGTGGTGGQGGSAGSIVTECEIGTGPDCNQCGGTLCADAIACTVESCGGSGVACTSTATDEVCRSAESAADDADVCMPLCFTGGCGTPPQSMSVMCTQDANVLSAQVSTCRIELDAAQVLGDQTSCVLCEPSPATGVELGSLTPIGGNAYEIDLRNIDGAARSTNVDCTWGERTLLLGSDTVDFDDLQYDSNDTSRTYTTVLGGTWTETNGVIAQTACTSGRLLHVVDTSTAWTNIMVEAEVRVEDSCSSVSSSYRQAGIVLRATSGGCNGAEFVTCMIDAASGQSGTDLVLAGQIGCSEPRQTSNLPGTVALDTWYKMTFRSDGSTLSCTLSGGGLSSSTTIVKSDSTRLTGGSVGFFAGAVQASFRNVRATLLP